jgi:hypothetical protein
VRTAFKTIDLFLCILYTNLQQVIKLQVLGRTGIAVKFKWMNDSGSNIDLLPWPSALNAMAYDTMEIIVELEGDCQ